MFDEYYSDEKIALLKKLIDLKILVIESTFKKIGYSFINKKTFLQNLLDLGADVNAGSGSLLLDACAKRDENESIEIVELLLKHNANPNLENTSKDWFHKMSPLHFAVDNKSVRILKHLINASADVNAFTENGKNPLMLAYERGNVEIIDILIKANATAPEDEILKIKFMNLASKKTGANLLN